jgi:VanZ family protein
LTGRFRFKLYLILLVVFTVVLAVLSLRSFSVSAQVFSNQDKVGHFIAYALTSWLACQVLGNRLKPLSTLFFSFLYASVTGAVLEIMQAYLTTTRQGEWADLVANLLGALTGCVMFSLRQHFKSNNECNDTDNAA